MTIRTYVMTLVLLATLSSIGFAETVYLKDGEVVSGEIVSENEYSLILKVGRHHNKYFKETGCISSFFRGIKNTQNNIIFFNSDLVVSVKVLNRLIKDDKNYIPCRKKINKKKLYYKM